MKKGTKVWVKPGTTLQWRKGEYVKGSGNNVVVTGLWGEGVTGTINKKFVKRR